MIEVREVLRGWLERTGLRTVAGRAGVDRKTARRYVQAAQVRRDLHQDEVVKAIYSALERVTADTQPLLPAGTTGGGRFARTPAEFTTRQTIPPASAGTTPAAGGGTSTTEDTFVLLRGGQRVTLSGKTLIFKKLDGPQFVKFFATYFGRPGEYQIFCKDLDWLDPPERASVVDALKQHGAKVEVFLSQDTADACARLRANGVRIRVSAALCARQVFETVSC